VKQNNFSASDFQMFMNLSDKKIKNFEIYIDMLIKWNKRINLVSSSTVKTAWFRHVLDSAQIYSYLPKKTKSLIDFGSGAGFPGMVMALIGVPKVHLVESKTKKAEFLYAVCNATGADVQIHNSRIESLASRKFDVITARALAPLTKLLEYGFNFSNKNSVQLYLKGRNVETELTQAKKKWNMDLQSHQSVTDPESRVLSISKVSKIEY